MGQASEECYFFQKGYCRYGDSCRYRHTKREKGTNLLDPPAWILSSYQDGANDVQCAGYSFEEVRFSFYEAAKGGRGGVVDFFQKWNSMVRQYLEMYRQKLDAVVGRETMSSSTGRAVDMRDERNRGLFIREVNMGALGISLPEREAPSEKEAAAQKSRGGEASGEVKKYELGGIPRLPPGPGGEG